MRVHPTLERSLATLWGQYARAYLWYVRARNAVVRPYGTGIDPLQVVRVDPDRIEHRTNSFEKSKFKYAGEVIDGDWDRVDRPFEETDVYRAYEAHFREGVPWTETAFFHRVVDQIAAGKTMWGCTTRAEFERRCRRIDRLYEIIRDHGYKSQRELLAENAPDPIEKRRSSLTERIVRDEVAVSVARDGELLFSDGRNRLAIAKVLGLDEIPVWILVRHADWQRFRAAVADGERDIEELPADVRDHPDIRPLLHDGA